MICDKLWCSELQDWPPFGPFRPMLSTAKAREIWKKQKMVVSCTRNN